MGTGTTVPRLVFDGVFDRDLDDDGQDEIGIVALEPGAFKVNRKSWPATLIAARRPPLQAFLPPESPVHPNIRPVPSHRSPHVDTPPSLWDKLPVPQLFARR